MTTVIPLKCPSCGANINVDKNAESVTCGYCGSQNAIQRAISAGSPASERPAPIRPRAKPDGSIKIENSAERLRITRRWFTPATIFLAFFTLVWDGFLIFWYTMAMGGGAPVEMLLVPLLHLVVGIYLTYTVLCGFVNRTIVELNREQLEVWFDPMPWPGEKTIQTAQIKQLYCKERVKRSKNGPRYSYQLFAVTQDDEEVKVLSGLHSPDIAAVFEQEIERWLRIEDHPVVGEYGK